MTGDPTFSSSDATAGVVTMDVMWRTRFRGTVVSAIITNEAVSELELASGKSATALIKASHVILGVAA